MSQQKPANGTQNQRQAHNSDGGQEQNQDQKKVPQRLIKLISVRLKEAAMDSPSFRASLNWYNNNIDQTDQWIDGLLKFMKKYPQQYNDFKDFNDVLLKQLMPDFLNNGLLDQDNTQNILDTTKTNLNSIWQESLASLDFREPEIVDLLTNLSKKFVKPYKEIRKNFDFLQARYDQMLSKYLSQTKTKDPSAIREDAFQLFEIRKSYLAASLDMCLEISRFHHTFDTCLVQLAELVAKGKKVYHDNYFSKVKAWNAATAKSIESLLEDLERSKEKIEQVTIAQVEPARDLNLHNPAMINPAKLTTYDPAIDGEAEQEYEKHGWLFMKTTVGKPTRQIWVRRWVFIKSGIFGLFSLAPSKNFVQETDKIGVLLCNIRYAPDEERRFCFEIKTIDSTIVFQAETLRDLRSWIRIFSGQKERALTDSQNDTERYAFGRYPPILYEFASTATTSVDVELTSSKVQNSNNDETTTTFTSSHLANLVNQAGHAGFDTSSNPHLPVNTARSKLALLSHEFTNPTVVPTAITANVWGSVNWGLYYMEDGGINSVATITAKSSKNNSSLSRINQGGVYPSYYPSHLKIHDIHLKALFGTSISEDEYVVTHFSCLWAMNPEQELSGTSYITAKNVYFHLNSAGFVSLIKKPLSEIVAVDVTIDKDWDTLKVYDIEGLSMKGRLFLEDGKLIQQILDLLINDNAKEHPSSNEQILKLLENLKSEEDDAKKTEVGSSSHKGGHRSELSSIQPFKGVIVENKGLRTNYISEYDFCDTKSFNVPAKALFHILLGDNSHIVRDSISFAAVDDFRITPWYQKGDELARYIDCKIHLARDIINLRGSESRIDITVLQTLEEMVDNKYYRINEKRNSIKFLINDIFRVERKLVIIEQDAKSCKLLVYFRVIPTSSSPRLLLNRLVEKTIVYYQKRDVAKCFEKLKHAAVKLGQHGKIIKSIRTYGNLGKADEPFREKEEVAFEFKNYVAFRYYSQILFESLVRLILKFVNFFFFELSKFIHNLSLNKVLLGILALSVLLNLFLTGKTTVSFWHAIRVENNLKKIKESLRLNRMERSIKLDEIELLQSDNFNSTSKVFQKFLASESQDSSKISYDARFRKSRHQLSVKRNELLVELKILEKVEKELVAGSYKSFLLSELHHCKVAINDFNVDDPSLAQYCHDCADELEKVSQLL